MREDDGGSAAQVAGLHDNAHVCQCGHSWNLHRQDEASAWVACTCSCRRSYKELVKAARTQLSFREAAELKFGERWGHDT